MNAPKAIIHVVDDDGAFRNAVQVRCKSAGGYAVQTLRFGNGVFAVRFRPMRLAVSRWTCGCPPSGLDLQSAFARSENPLLHRVHLTGHGDISAPAARDAAMKGAEDFLSPNSVKKAVLFPAIERARVGTRRAGTRAQRARHRGELRSPASILPTLARA